MQIQKRARKISKMDLCRAMLTHGFGQQLRCGRSYNQETTLNCEAEQKIIRIELEIEKI